MSTTDWSAESDRINRMPEIKALKRRWYDLNQAALAADRAHQAAFQAEIDKVKSDS